MDLKELALGALDAERVVVNPYLTLEVHGLPFVRF
jgi:hypothetical protein